MNDGFMKETGVFDKGYGNVYRYVMLNPDIPIAAKTLYAYFCSYGDASNENTEIYPSVQTIIDDLNMNKETYLKAINILIERDLVIRTLRLEVIPGERPKQTSNSYTINLKPNTYRPNPKCAVCTGTILDYKYGPISKGVMRDRNIKNWKSKCLYAYYCSFIGSDDFSIIDIGKVCYFLRVERHALSRMKKDIENVYLRHEDLRDEHGHKIKGQKVFVLGINASKTDIKPESPAEMEEEVQKNTSQCAASRIVVRNKKGATKEFLEKIGYYSEQRLQEFMIKSSPEEFRQQARIKLDLLKIFSEALYEIYEEYPALRGCIENNNLLRIYAERAIGTSNIADPKRYLLKCISTEFADDGTD